MAIRRIGQIFVDLGFIDDDQLEMLLEEQQENRPNELLGVIAESLGLVNEDQVAQALAEQMGMQVFALSEAVIPPEVLNYITEPMAQLYRIVPIAFNDGTLTVAMAEPQKLHILDELRNFLGYNVRAVVSTGRELQSALDRYYQASGETISNVIDGLANDENLKKAAYSLTKEGPIDITDVTELVDSAGSQTAEHGAAAGHQRPGQRLALRTV